MFGYVNICRSSLSDTDFEIFRSYYCGLCKAIGAYSQTARLGLSYDMTFLAILLSGVSKEKIGEQEQKCILHPFSKRRMEQNNQAISYAAGMSVLLGYYKLWDDWQDEKSLRARCVSLLYRYAVRKLEKQYPKQNEAICSCLLELSAMEQERTADADEMADCFARILQALFLPDFVRGEETRRILSWLGYNLGRWIYLIDAVNDVEKDQKRGQYNPYLAEYEKIGKAALSKRLETTLTYCLANVAAAYDLLNISEQDGVLRNILFDGVRQSQAGVLKTEDEHGSI